MSNVDFEDEDVDALLDMCWTENPEDVPESPCATGKADFADMYNNASTLPDESYVYIREVGCDHANPASMSALRAGLRVNVAPVASMEPEDDLLVGMIPVPSANYPSNKSAQSLPPADVNLLDLPFDDEVPVSSRQTELIPENHSPIGRALESPKPQSELQRTVQRPVCSDNFGDDNQRAPQIPSRAPQVFAAEDPRSITTLATTSSPSDELEALEEAIIEETQRIREIEKVLEARKSRRDQLRRDYAMALVKSVSPQPTPVSFTVVVTRSGGRPNIGLVVGYDEDQGYLVVTKVKSDGLIPEANEERRTRNLPLVEEGDHLISINGVSGDKYMMTRELVEGPLTIQLVFVKKLIPS